MILVRLSLSSIRTNNNHPILDDSRHPFLDDVNIHPILDDSSHPFLDDVSIHPILDDYCLFLFYIETNELKSSKIG